MRISRLVAWLTGFVVLSAAAVAIDVSSAQSVATTRAAQVSAAGHATEQAILQGQPPTGAYTHPPVYSKATLATVSSLQQQTVQMPPQSSKILNANTPDLVPLTGLASWHLTNIWIGAIGWTRYYVTAGSEAQDVNKGVLIVFSQNDTTAAQAIRFYWVSPASGTVTIDGESDGIISFHTTGGASGTFDVVTDKFGG